MPGGVENVIKYCNEAGINSIELMSNDVEDFLGAPKNPMMAMFASPPPPPAPPASGAAPAGCSPPPQRRQLTQDQKDEIAKYNSDIKAWRLALPMSKY